MDISGYTTAAGFSSGTEAFASDIEGGTIKKEKKKKKVKNKELLHHREKIHPEKIKGKYLCLYLHACMHASQQKVKGYNNPKFLVKIPATQVTHIVGNSHP